MWKSELHGSDDKLPTVSQWLKTTTKESAEVIRIVKFIWVPNAFNNYSLDTEAYRVRIPENHPLFAILEEHLDSWIENRSVVAISIEAGKKPVVCLQLLEREQADWDALGDYGFKRGQVEAKEKKRDVRKRNAATDGKLITPGSSTPQEGASE